MRAHALLGEAVVIDHLESGSFGTAGFCSPLEAVLMILRRHPMRRNQIEAALHGLPGAQIEATLAELESAGRVQPVIYRGMTYYTAAEGQFAGRP